MRSIVTHTLILNVFVTVSKTALKRDSKTLSYFPNYVILNYICRSNRQCWINLLLESLKSDFITTHNCNSRHLINLSRSDTISYSF